MDSVLKMQHRAQPLPGVPSNLSQKHRGRCQMKVQEVDFSKKCIPADRFGGYEPPVEAFSALAQAKTRQVRRLKSFRTGLQSYRRQVDQNNPQTNASRLNQLEMEWKKILNAKGYGRAWFRWVLSFPCIRSVPLSLPSCEHLSDYIQVTEHDANAACVQEANNRRAAFRFAIQTDMDEAFGSLTYKVVKNSQQMLLTEVPLVEATQATLLRSAKGNTLVRINPVINLTVGSQVAFGEATCVIQSIEQDVIGIQRIQGQVAAPLVAKLDNAFAKLVRIGMMPITIEQKCKIIQSSVWPAALYGADLHYIGKAHFNQLRRAACDAIIGYRKQANPFLAMILLSKCIMDPHLFAITSACRAIRRLCAIDMEQARNIVKVASVYDGKTTYGPATSLCRYLQIIQVTVDNDGWLWHQNRKLCNILVDQSKHIVHVMKHRWYEHVLQNEVSRRGIDTSVPYNVALTQRIFAELPNRHQKLVMLNLVGGFQSNAVKSTWAQDKEDTCELCGQVDHIAHRFTSCDKLAFVREKHPVAVQALQSHAEAWIYHPIARFHSDQQVVHTMLENFVQPEPPERIIVIDNEMTFFTDGGCLRPKDPRNRIGSWAVLQDLAPTRKDAIQQTKISCLQAIPYPWWHCVGLGYVPGRQTIDRAELFAVIYAIQAGNVRQVTIFTDSSYVIHVAKVVLVVDLQAMLHVMANPDLLQQLAEVLAAVNVTFHKVASHQDPLQADTWEQAWMYLGNNAVDGMCTQRLQTLPHEFTAKVESCIQWNKSEEDSLQQVLAFMVENNLARHELLQQHCGAEHGGRRNQDVCPFEQFACYNVEQTMCTLDGEPDHRIFAASLQGVKLGYHLFHWWKQIQWPVDDDAANTDNDELRAAGISWLELTINFFVSTGRFFPIRISANDEPARNAGSSIFLDYMSDEGRMQPHSLRAAARQVIACQNAVQSLSSISPQNWMPGHVSSGGFSLRRLGYKQNLKGLTPRPIIPYQSETMQQVRVYLESLQGSTNLSKPLDMLTACHFDADPQLEELPPHSRYKEYLKIRNYGLR
eukprot:Skav234953  [mRNA]  locus=scaffold2817:165851:170123:- [translate_table: standard]